LPKTFFHQEVGEMIIDETPIQERNQDLTIVGWTIIEEKQMNKINLGTKENVQQVKVNASLSNILSHNI
jgi:hypothetical protein